MRIPSQASCGNGSATYCRLRKLTDRWITSAGTNVVRILTEVLPMRVSAVARRLSVG